jgi:CRP-like cAMP-binding protein
MTIEDDIFFLERLTIFGPLGFSALQILAIGSEAKELQPGDVLFAAGDAADGGYIVQEGALRLELPGADPAEPIVVGPGTLLGELALVTETKRPVTATAIEPSTVMRVSRSLFRKVLEGFPDAARLMRDRIAARASEADNELQTVRDMLLPKPPQQRLRFARGQRAAPASNRQRAINCRRRLPCGSRTPRRGAPNAPFRCGFRRRRPDRSRPIHRSPAPRASPSRRDPRARPWPPRV